MSKQIMDGEKIKRSTCRHSKLCKRAICEDCATFTIYNLNEQLKPFKDDYFKGLSNEVIAELAKKSIRLTTEIRELDTLIENLCEPLECSRNDLYSSAVRLQKIAAIAMQMHEDWNNFDDINENYIENIKTENSKLLSEKQILLESMERITIHKEYSADLKNDTQFLVYSFDNLGIHNRFFPDELFDGKVNERRRH